MLRFLTRRTPVFLYRPLLNLPWSPEPVRNIHRAAAPSSRLRHVQSTHSPGSLVSSRPRPTYRPTPSSHTGFHSTSKREGLPFFILASVLKTSTAFEVARTTSRIVLTFLPVLLLQRGRSARIMKHANEYGIPLTDEKRESLLKNINKSTRLLKIMVVIPLILFWGTIIASLELTPLTGRLRTILLAPEEEDELAAQLAGQGWYTAVYDILAQDNEPRFIPSTDWRYRWVENTLQQIIDSLPILADEKTRGANWIEVGPDDPPLPPPAKHPLRPRFRAAEYLHHFCDVIHNKSKDPNASPYHLPFPSLRPVAPKELQLLVVDDPQASNAFAYGFGEGGSGIVVYSGFLDEIFSRYPVEYTKPPDERSWLLRILGVGAPQPRPTPTQTQTTELAVLLAHEVAHIILAHHLETLSSATIVVPGALSILADVVRVLVFPITMMFGPFVNDAVAQLGKVGSGELLKLQEYCTTTKQEVEADVVSARILAHAGFDARDAIKFWERRTGPAECHRADPNGERERDIARRIMGTGTGHPISEARIENLKSEIHRWETERSSALQRLNSEAKQ